MQVGQSLQSTRVLPPQLLHAPAAGPCTSQPSRQQIAGLQHRQTPPGAEAQRSALLQQARQVLLKAVRADQQSQQTDSGTLRLISEITAKVDEAHANILEQSTRSSERYTDPGADDELKAKVYGSIAKLSEGLLERETEVRLLLLAALCGEHLVLLGPPGTAKSELARRLSGLTSGTYFERLLTRFSVPEELFGPLSMRGLENDLYERQIAGYLPTAEVAFVDEIFKANSAILNALLTLLNERLFDNGSNRIDVPLLCLVGASNELPESEELDALYDRFLLRRSVTQVSAAQLSTLARLAAGRAGQPASPAASQNGARPGPNTPALAIEDFRNTRAASHEAVDVPEGVIDLLTDLRNWLQDKAEPPIYVSDRRFMKSIQLLQVAAFADGRDEVTAFDCLLLEFVYGNRPDDAQKVRQRVLDIISSDPGLQQTELVFLGLFGRACRVLESPESQEASDVEHEATDLVQLLTSRQAELASMLNGFPQLRSTIWFSEPSQQAAIQSLTPQMTENRGKVEDLLREAMVLQEAVSRRIEAGALEKLLPRRYKQYQKGISSRA